jgi:hypothetical protein
MASVTEGGILGFAAAAGPKRPVFFNLQGMRGLAGAFVGAVAEGWILGLSAGAEVEGLTGLGVDFVGEGLPAHGFIIQQSLKKESGS